MGSLLIHGLIFVFFGKTFIQRAQYSVQPSVQTVEVSMQEVKDLSLSKYTILSTSKSSFQVQGIPKKVFNLVKGSMQSVVARKEKYVGHSTSGVKTKANPDYFQNPSPEYPDLAKQMHQEGMVILSVDVNKDGDPVSVVIIERSGFRLLDQAAIKAVKHWKFQPGQVGGIPVESAVTIPIRFRLE